MILMALTLLLGTFTTASAQSVNEVISLTNAEREHHGLPALRTDSQLNEFAAIRAREIVGQTSQERARHVRPNGQTATRWVLDETGGRFMGAGENSALGTSGHIGPARVVEGWMNSTGHRRNILGQSADFTHIGVGFYSDGVNDFWVQIFAVERTAGGTAAQNDPPAVTQPATVTPVVPAAPPATSTPAVQPPRVVIPATDTPAAQPPRVVIPVTPPAAGTTAAQPPRVVVPITTLPAAVPSGVAAATAPRTAITTANAATMTQQAIEVAAPGATAIVSVVNQAEIELAAMQAVTAAAGGRAVRINADSRTDAGLDVRVSLNPAAATRDINLAASTTSARAQRTQALFSRSFEGPMMVISMEQQGNFGTEVRVTTRIDSELDADNLFFYSFDRETNRFTRFTPNTRVDDNGFLHFNTTLAGCIIISNTRF